MKVIFEYLIFILVLFFIGFILFVTARSMVHNSQKAKEREQQKLLSIYKKDDYVVPKLDTTLLIQIVEVRDRDSYEGKYFDNNKRIRYIYLDDNDILRKQ